LFIHILPPISIKGFNHMGWLKTCWLSTNSPFSCFNSDKFKKTSKCFLHMRNWRITLILD
jgi:hypothetical protein